ncbi:MAG: ribonuclease P protein component [Mycoplasmatales bacterium]
MKKHVLKKNEDFNKIIKEGKKIGNTHFTVYSLPSLSLNYNSYNIGISVGKKLGDAHVRNRQKRIVRNIIRHLSKEVEFENRQYVVMSKPICLKSNFEEQENKLFMLFKKEK